MIKGSLLVVASFLVAHATGTNIQSFALKRNNARFSGRPKTLTGQTLEQCATLCLEDSTCRSFDYAQSVKACYPGSQVEPFDTLISGSGFQVRRRRRGYTLHKWRHTCVGRTRCVHVRERASSGARLSLTLKTPAWFCALVPCHAALCVQWHRLSRHTRL